MNAVAYNNLHPDVKPIFDRIVGAYRERMLLAWNVQDFMGVSRALDEGVTFIDLTDDQAAEWLAATDSVVESYVTRTVAAGYSEAEVRAWLAYYKDRTSYWIDKQAELGIISAVGPPKLRPEAWAR